MTKKLKIKRGVMRTIRRASSLARLTAQLKLGIKIDKKRTAIHWDASNKTVTIPVAWNTKSELEINIKLKK